MEHPLTYKVVKDYGSYIMWEAKLSPFWRLVLGLPFILLGILLCIPSLFVIFKKGSLPSLSVLFLLLIGAFLILLGLAIIGSWKALILDGVMGTITLHKYFLWLPFKKVYHFSEIEGLEISRTTRQFSEEYSPQEYFEISLLYEGAKISIDGSTNKEEAGEFARKVAQIVGRQVIWS